MTEEIWKTTGSRPSSHNLLSSKVGGTRRAFFSPASPGRINQRWEPARTPF